MVEFSFSQIAQWLGIESKISTRVSGFKQNSQEVQPGDLFFAVKGEKVDGHSFLKEIAAKGALGAVVSKEYRGEDFGLQLLRVENVIAALHHLAKTVHHLRKIRVIGVTGSVGKTTTKEYIATLLEGKFRVAKTPGNANSQVSLPLYILNSEGNEEVCVMEMGMSLPGEIEKLVDIAPPEMALVTKIAMSHVAYFPEALEGIASEKAKIFSHAQTHLAIINHQAATFSSMQSSCVKTTYGMEAEGNDCDYVLCKEEDHFYIKEKGERTPAFSLPFTASHLCENFLGAAVVARKMGMQWSEIASQAQKLVPFKRRFERIEREGIVFINDSYNANVTSMKAALANLPLPHPGKKRIAVFSAMTELGPHVVAAHCEVAHAALASVDHLLCWGEDTLEMVSIFKAAERTVEYFEDFKAMKKRVFEVAEVGDVVLIKGANSKKMWMILEA